MKRQRQDVKIMKEQWATIGASPLMIDIARRVSNIILALEETLTTPNCSYYNSRRNRVLKDSEIKK